MGRFVPGQEGKAQAAPRRGPTVSLPQSACPASSPFRLQLCGSCIPAYLSSSVLTLCLSILPASSAFQGSPFSDLIIFVSKMSIAQINIRMFLSHSTVCVHVRVP